MSLIKKVIIFGFEAFLLVTFGLFFLFCNTILAFKNRLPEKIAKKIVNLFPFLKVLGFGKVRQPRVAPRIESESCCICYNEIQKEVSSTCGHIFCGKCLIDFWESKERKKIDCPLCRRTINLILINFPKNDIQPNDSETKRIIDNVRFYNACFSNSNRTLYQSFMDAPYLIKRLIATLHTREGFNFLLKRVLGSLFTLASLLYILSPLDFIPDCIIIIGWIDDAIVMTYLLLSITKLYYNFLQERN